MERKVLINSLPARAVMTLLFALFACFSTVMADEVEIGDDGTSSNAYVPVQNLYEYGWTQQIYTSAEIGMAGTINSVAFKNTGAEKTRTLSVYIQHTDKETFESGTDWVAMSVDDLVFSGEVTFAVDEWTTLTLNTPFVYDGSSNIVIGVADNSGNWSSSPHLACLVFDATGQAIYHRRDNNPYDTSAPAVQGTVLDVKNQIIVNITPSGGPVVIKPKAPTNLACDALTATTATLSWTENGTATRWQICLNGDEENLIDVTENPYTLTGLTEDVSYTAKIRAVGDEAVSNWSNTVIFSPTAKVVIGSGTATNSYLPTYTFYNYSLTQQIYTAAELGNAGVIESIDFHSSMASTRNLDIYMVHTDKSSFSSTTDWVSVTAADLVFSGSVDFDANVWTTIPLTNAFEYDGNSNVVLVVDDNTGSYESSPGFFVFDARNAALRVYSDGTNYDPTSPTSYTGYVMNVKNQLRLVKSALSSCKTPTNLALVGEPTYNSAQLTWTPGDEGQDAWQICVNGDEENLIDANSIPFTLTGITAETAYTVKVRSNCGGGEFSRWSPVLSFETKPIIESVSTTHTSATISWTGISDSYKLRYRKAETLLPTAGSFFDDFEGGLGKWTLLTLADGSGWTKFDPFGFGEDYNAHSGTFVAMARSYENGVDISANNWMISPQLTIPESMSYWVLGDAGYPETYYVCVSTAGTDPADFEVVATYTTNPSSWTQEVIDLSEYEGQTGYVAFHHQSEASDYLWIDDVIIGEMETVPAGEWSEINTTETTAEITGLESNTNYEYQIVCINGGTTYVETPILTFATLSESVKQFSVDGNWDDADNWTPAGVPTTDDNVVISAAAIIPSGVVANAHNIKIDGGSITIKDGGQLIHNNEGIVATVEKNIKGYGDSERGGYYLLSVPIVGSVEPGDIAGMTDGDYDLYAFDFTEDGEQWRNYKTANFVLSKGYSYLYANKNDVTLSFTGELIPLSGFSYLTGYYMNYSTDGHLFNNWNLAGNPFPCDSYVSLGNYNSGLYVVSPAAFYTLNAAGDEIVLADVTTGVAEGLFVVAQEATNVLFASGRQYCEHTTTEPSDMVLPQHGMTTHQSAAPVFVLNDDATTNADVISSYNEYSGLNIQLGGRTLYADGNWNTITLPFNVTLAESPLAGAIAKTVTEARIDGSTLYINFGEAVDELQAGVPYIIRWAEGADIVEPVFYNVTIDEFYFDYDNEEEDDARVMFRGNYDAKTYTAATPNIYLMGANNKLYYPNGKGEASLGAFRAYFELGEGVSLANYSLNFGDDETTGIRSIDGGVQIPTDGWYTLDGRKLNGMPLQKGVYINNGRKVVVK